MARIVRTLRSRTRDAVVCERCLLADSPVPRAVGLLGRSRLDEDEGVLLTPANAIHTHFMRFAIDVVFLDREGRVLDVRAELRPWRAARAKGARSVVELAAGAAARRGVEVGDELALDDG